MLTHDKIAKINAWRMTNDPVTAKDLPTAAKHLADAMNEIANLRGTLYDLALIALERACGCDADCDGEGYRALPCARCKHIGLILTGDEAAFMAADDVHAVFPEFPIPTAPTPFRVIRDAHHEAQAIALDQLPEVKAALKEAI